MLWLLVSVPLMVLALVAAVLPLLLTILHDRRAEQNVTRVRRPRLAPVKLAEAA